MMLFARFSAITVSLNTQFMLYSSIVCYQIHIKLTHINFLEGER